ncbi:MAG: hypothetical protein GW836_00650 [Paraglaciecola sp.]|nr:hypothetical protein [Paraglaciecola sp.]
MSQLIHSAAWLKIKAALESDRKDLVEQLVRQDNPEVRGSIKQIDDILDRYPAHILAIKEEE